VTALLLIIVAVLFGGLGWAGRSRRRATTYYDDQIYDSADVSYDDAGCNDISYDDGCAADDDTPS
jgi:hypothetical protein